MRREARGMRDDVQPAAIALQARVGLGVATDGEFRRRSYHSYFYRQLGDIPPGFATERLFLPEVSELTE